VAGLPVGRAASDNAAGLGRAVRYVGFGLYDDRDAALAAMVRLAARVILSRKGRRLRGVSNPIAS